MRFRRYRRTVRFDDPRSVSQLQEAQDEIRHNVASLFAIAPRPPKRMPKTTIATIRRLSKEFHKLQELIDSKEGAMGAYQRAEARRKRDLERYEKWKSDRDHCRQEIPF